MKFAGRWGKVLFKLADVAVHLLFKTVNKLVDLAIGAFGDQFNAAVREIPDISANVVLKRDILGGITKSNPLDATRKMARTAMDIRLVTGYPVLIVRRWCVDGVHVLPSYQNLVIDCKIFSACNRKIFKIWQTFHHCHS